MKALLFDKKLRFSENEPIPTPPPGEALIKIKMAGICNTDIEITKGYMGFKGIPGHEFVGVVEKINDADQSLLGKRVVGEINCACRQPDCEYCQRDLGRHCPNRTTLGIFNRNGCLSEYITLPLVNLLEVPDNIPDEIATLTEPLAAGFEILEQLTILPSHEVLIVGDGKLGLLINHALSTTGAKITHVGKHADKLELVKTNGCKTILLDEMPEKKYDIVVEATGSASGFDFSVSHTKPRGTLVLKSTIAADQKINMNPVVVDEITIVGSRCGLFKPALEYIKTGVDLSPIVQKVFPTEKALDAFELAKTRGSLKVMVDFN
ncbi:MAG: alcohol dehydrogenase catalytic domain-containing protein [Prolixibacteraceae bacterium]|nr:alcohol dehydrogenase catalytic domain-containing protein [Prolixibacteraceae bacterium]